MNIRRWIVTTKANGGELTLRHASQLHFTDSDEPMWAYLPKGWIKGGSDWNPELLPDPKTALGKRWARFQKLTWEEQREPEHRAEWQALFELRTKARTKALAAAQKATRARKVVDRRLGFGDGTGGVCKTVFRRVRAMRARDSATLMRIDTQIVALQRRREALIRKAWEGGIKLENADQIGKLLEANRTGTGKRDAIAFTAAYGGRHSYDRTSALDHHNTIPMQAPLTPAQRKAKLATANVADQAVAA